MRAYISGSTQAGQGPYTSGLTIVDLDGPSISVVGTAATSVLNPMYLAMHPNERTVYVAHAHGEGLISAWRVSGDDLVEIGVPRASGGTVPCHLTVHPSGRYLLTANYRDGSISVHPLDDDGTIGDIAHRVQHDGTGPHSPRQDGPHVHMVLVDPVDESGRGQVLAADLGNDTLYRYELNTSTGELDEIDHVELPPGSGPRHLVVHGSYAYVVGELTSTLHVICLDTSPPTVVTTVATQPHGSRVASYPSAIRLSPSVRRFHVLNRGPNTIATFAINGPDTCLTSTNDAGVDYPWDLALYGDHAYVVGQRSSTVRSLRVDPRTGHMAVTRSALVNVLHPVCILPAPAQRGSAVPQEVMRGP